MSQHQYDFSNLSTGSINDFNSTTNLQHNELDVAEPSRNRRDDTNFYIGILYEETLIQRPGERVVVRKSGRKNKNEILGLTLALLTKEKYLKGNKYLGEVERLRGIQMLSNNTDFVLILRTNGRIVAMSDEVEHHLGKSMRSLYTQCINIFACLDKTDGNKLGSILNSPTKSTNEEHRLVCTFRLPKGKRPSREREDIKAISMAGHFYSCHDSSSSSSEMLFIARCEALVSRVTNGSNSTQTAMINNNQNTNSTVKITLKEDMSIDSISSNVKEMLGYSRNEMINSWFGRYLATKDLEKFETICQRHFQHEQQQPISVCDLFDIHTNNGDGRLTFLCQIRPVRERKSKPIKFTIVAQLIDPSLRDEYEKYVQTEYELNPKAIKAEQVNLVPPSVSKTSQDTILADSPSLAMGLFDNTNSNDCTRHQQQSPFCRSLSNAVAPVHINDEYWSHLIDFGYNQYPTTADLHYCPTKSVDNVFFECQSEQGLANGFDDLLNEYYTGGYCC